MSDFLMPWADVRLKERNTTYRKKENYTAFTAKKAHDLTIFLDTSYIFHDWMPGGLPCGGMCICWVSVSTRFSRTAVCHSAVPVTRRLVPVGATRPHWFPLRHDGYPAFLRQEQGFEPWTYRMQSGRATTELHAPVHGSLAKMCSPGLAAKG